VRKLSQRSDRFNDEIRMVISNSRHSIETARETVGKLASKDMTVAIQSKSRVDGMMKQIGVFNDQLQVKLGEVSTIADDVSQSVGNAVRSLQFEDIVSQLVQHAGKHLDSMEGMVELVQSGVSNISMSKDEGLKAYVQQLEALLEQLRQLDTEKKSMGSNGPVAQQSMDQGEVELF
jgi:methyl-accepting chemotaxis protein